jgi:Raf kinase inhibitor-like YbhB/YbcL family protein
MKFTIITLIILFIGALAVYLANNSRGNAQSKKQLDSNPMKLTSSAFLNGETIPMIFTCDGANHNPPLTFSNVPSQAQSLVLIMDDPDVPKNLLPSGVFDHWAVFNMPPTTRGLGENQIPSGVTGNNGAGKAQYTGPCPPDREHRYFFRLYALDRMLDLNTGATKTQIIEAMKSHIIEQAELIGRYNRPQNIKK